MRKIFAVFAAIICCLSIWTSTPEAFTLDKEDGEYSIQVDLEGGSGKASVTSPTLITVQDGAVTAHIQWSSSNYDYMIVDGKNISRSMKKAETPNLKSRFWLWMKQCPSSLTQPQWVLPTKSTIH